MPKIIPDIHNKILSIAEFHFKDNGFEKTDMREIAADSNVAVGTVYLHFLNKEELYQKVIQNSWSNTFEKIQSISQISEESEIILEKIFFILIEEMTNRKSHESLLMEIGSFHHHDFFQAAHVDHFSGMRDPITGILSGVIQKMANENGRSLEKSTCIQLGRFVFIMTVDLCMQDPLHAKKKINLIHNLISAYINQ